MMKGQPLTGELVDAGIFGAALAGEDDTDSPPQDAEPGVYRKSMQPPAQIHTKEFNPFVVDKEWGWAYTGYGVFASGNFQGEDPESPERDVLIPYEGVTLIELDFSNIIAGDEPNTNTEHDHGEHGETDSD
jgi:hypothetical protein